MGLAVLPARLKDEMAKVRENLAANVEDISSVEEIAKHADWYKEIRAKYDNINADNADGILKTEIGIVFSKILEHAGVFKRDENGLAAFDKFVESVSK